MCEYRYLKRNQTICFGRFVVVTKSKRIWDSLNLLLSDQGSQIHGAEEGPIPSWSDCAATMNSHYWPRECNRDSFEGRVGGDWHRTTSKRSKRLSNHRKLWDQGQYTPNKLHGMDNISIVMFGVTVYFCLCPFRIAPNSYCQTFLPIYWH